jgi:beta-lactamase regulating signal transducer with metallopeptidase domain
MMAVNLEAVASYSSMRLVDSLAEGLAVCLFAALILRLSRRQNAGTRFAIGFAALLAIAVLPLARGLWPHSQLASSAPAVVVPESWAVYLFSAWAVIAMLLLARVAVSVWHLHQLRTTCVALDSARIDPLVATTLQRNKTGRKIVLCTSEKVRVPTALGFFRPAIVIPRWLLEQLSAGELNQVVLHELAHLRRCDDWTNLAQQIVKALLFFHPAVWWIEKKIALDREMACDDAVLAETESPREYAQCLAHLAEMSFVQRGVALAQALIGRIGQTSQRVAQILDVNRPKGNARTWNPAIWAMVGVGVLCSVWTARGPELVGFDNGTPNRTEFASSVADRVSVPIINAKFVQRSTPEWTSAKTAPAKLSRRSVPRNPIATATQPVTRHREAASNLIHLSALKPQSAPTSETLLVMIESRELGPGNAEVYRIQMWHVTVLPLTEAVGSKTPSKKT